jgi:hypothetical protein
LFAHVGKKPSRSRGRARHQTTDMALQYLTTSQGWLSFSHSTPTLYVTAEDEDFDDDTLRAWRDEGFVKYIPMGKGGKTYVNTLHHLGDGMGIGERYAIVGTWPFPATQPARTIEHMPRSARP